MYTLLLVDDEEEVTRIIAKKVKWNDLGFSVTGHANNGLKALEMLEEMQPDVVMTDIRMPYMDGLELCGQIREKYPATKLVLFTGFDDFEYAKEAVHLEIEEYVLKPLNAAEITKVFEDLKKKLDQEINEKKSAELLKKYYKDSLPLLQANFYSTLIEGRVPEEELTKYLANYQIDFTGPLYGCVLIHASKTQVPKDMDPQLVAISVDKQAGERLEQKWKAKRFNYLGDTVMIVQLESEKEVSELTDSCDRFCKYVHHMIGAVVTVGVGQICDNISDLVKSYQSAREAVSYRVLYGSNQAINLKEIEARILEKWLLNICLVLHEDMANARDHSKKSLIDQAKEYVHNNYSNEALNLDDICSELGVSNSYFSSIFKKETGQSFVAYLTGYRMEKAARMLVETSEKSYMIAKSVGYTDPNYFSYVFKRQYGVSPSKYRTEYESN